MEQAPLRCPVSNGDGERCIFRANHAVKYHRFQSEIDAISTTIDFLTNKPTNLNRKLESETGMSKSKKPPTPLIPPAPRERWQDFAVAERSSFSEPAKVRVVLRSFTYEDGRPQSITAVAVPPGGSGTTYNYFRMGPRTKKSLQDEADRICVNLDLTRKQPGSEVTEGGEEAVPDEYAAGAVSLEGLPISTLTYNVPVALEQLAATAVLTSVP